MRSRTSALEVPESELETLDSVWHAGLSEAFAAYGERTSDPRVALAAGLVEVGVTLQGVGSHVAAPGELLIGDLCLARASRLLADIADQRLQVAFARVVERVTTEAAEGREVSDVRQLLLSVLGVQL